LLDLVILVIGKEHIDRVQRKRLRTLLELSTKTDFHENDFTKRESKPVKEQIAPSPNEIKAEENSFDLANAPHFNFPKGEFNLEVEGEEGIRAIKIMPDGRSEVN